MPTEYYLGCISGTSVDGLDLAIVAIEPQRSPQIVAADTIKLPERLQQNLLRLATPGDGELDLCGHCDAELGEFIGTSILQWLTASGFSANQIRAIGSHGQTVRHRPSSDHTAFTLQIGDPNRIAELTGLTTVADFRRRDMAAGGQGAPLVPPFHKALFAHLGQSTVVLNIGGIANISLLEDPVSGFDTGPGNGLMDAWCLQHQQKPYDKSGAWASTGQVNETLLQMLCSDPYFQAPPPKSTGREYFQLSWLNQHLTAFPDIVSADVQATLAEFTAQTIHGAIARWAKQVDQLIVCGGGRLNLHLMQRLRAISGISVEPSERYGVDGDAIEAAAFAWLAHQTLAGLAGNAPRVTGASGERVLGAIHPGGN